MTSHTSCLWIQDGGISHFYELRKQEQQSIEIISNHWRKQKKKKVAKLKKKVHKLMQTKKKTKV